MDPGDQPTSGPEPEGPPQAPPEQVPPQPAPAAPVPVGMRVEGRHAPRTFARRVHTRSYLGSVGLHLAILGLLIWTSGLGPTTRPPKPPIPITLLTPQPKVTPRPRPRAVGDLAVRATPAPTPSPTPQPTPTPRPTPTPKASPTPKPTPRPTPRPTPKPTPTPTGAPRPTPAERKKFEQMKKIPYFSKMSEEQLRKQPIPPGFKDWGQVLEMGRKLDGLQWLFLPPETGESGGASTPPIQPSPASTAAAATPRPTAAPGTPGPAGSPGASPSPLPSPSIEKTDAGVNVMRFQVEKTVFVVTWGDDAENAVIEFKPEDAPEDQPGRTFEVPVEKDLAKFLQDILAGWAKALEASPPPGSPAP